MDLTEAQWNLVEPRLPQDPVRPDGRGRPWSDRRQVLNGGLWLVRTGAPWQALPDRYGPHQTVHRRFQNWGASGRDQKHPPGPGGAPQRGRGLDLTECFVDGTFVPAQKGGVWSGKPSGARAPRSWALPTARGCLSPCGQKALRRLR